MLLDIFELALVFRCRNFVSTASVRDESKLILSAPCIQEHFAIQLIVFTFRTKIHVSSKSGYHTGTKETQVSWQQSIERRCISFPYVPVLPGSYPIKFQLASIQWRSFNTRPRCLPPIDSSSMFHRIPYSITLIYWCIVNGFHCYSTYALHVP